MSYPTLCAGCSLGEHSKHDGGHHGAPGLIGGTYCPCQGGCKPPELPLGGTEPRQETAEAVARVLWSQRTSEDYDQRLADFPDSQDIAKVRRDAALVLAAIQPAPSRTVWLVHHAAEPLPHTRWSGDRFWPNVEVYEAWADAFKRLGELRDWGIPVNFEEVRLYPGVSR